MIEFPLVKNPAVPWPTDDKCALCGCGEIESVELLFFNCPMDVFLQGSNLVVAGAN